MACDLCGKVSGNLDALRGEWQTKEVKFVCGGCRDDLDNVIKFYMFRFSERMIKRWIARQRKKLNRSPWYEKMRFSKRKME